MKRIAFLFLVGIAFSSCGNALAQLRHVNLYWQLGGGWGTANTLNIGGTVMYKQWAATYDYVGQHSRAENVPSDYNPGLHFFNDGIPKKALEGHCIEGARVFYFANHTLRFLARGGIFLGTYGVPKNFRGPYGGWGRLFLSNYDYDWQITQAPGFVLHPTIEWPGGAPIGASAGIRIIVTEPQTTVAIDFNVLLGKVRKSRNTSFYERDMW